jgi:Tfp pilus assembly protein PilF
MKNIRGGFKKMRYFYILFAVLILAASVSAQVNLADKHFAAATDLAKAGNFAAAIVSYEKALQIVEAEAGLESNKLRSRIHYNIGVCFYKSGKFRAAGKEFSRAAILDSDENARIHYAQGLNRLELGELKGAEKALKKAVSLDEKHAEARFDLAMIYVGRKDFEQAKEFFRKAVELETVRTAEALNNIGVIEAFEGDLPSAEKNFRKAFERSEGKLVEAGQNLDFCRRYRTDARRNLLAGLVFTKRKGVKNG